ncbi:helix-turn-helix domain-containing protein [bacterium]|nr:helix-turn-helix domain-containing protein [bacterium]PWL80671.1 MAG: phosphoribosylglycinamide formyltransferase [Candidatus Gastranaerophilales bacterium]
MSARGEIKSILAKENITMTDLAKKIPTSVNNLSNKLRNNTIKYEEVRQIADILGYDIQFVKRK